MLSHLILQRILDNGQICSSSLLIDARERQRTKQTLRLVKKLDWGPEDTEAARAKDLDISYPVAKPQGWMLWELNCLFSSLICASQQGIKENGLLALASYRIYIVYIRYKKCLQGNCRMNKRIRHGGICL